MFTGNVDEVLQGLFPPFVKPLMGEGSLLFLNGQRHLRERKLMMPPFHGERMGALGGAIRDIANAAIDRWPVGEVFPLHREMQGVAIETILKTVYGMEEGARLVSLRILLEEQSNAVKRTSGLRSSLMSLAMLTIPGPTLDRLYLFSLRHPRWAPLFPWARAVRIQNQMDVIFLEEITRAKAEGGTRPDILSMLVAARDEDGEPMTVQQLRDEMMTLLAAGFETTATALSWFFHFVLGSPECLAKLQAENALASVDGTVPLQAINQLNYLDAAIKETLRVQAVAPHISRLLVAPKKVGTLDLPAGVMVLGSIYLTQRRPDLFEELTRFRPERFLGHRFTPYEYFPFGGGVRRCIGMTLATFEMKIVISQMLSRLTLRAAPGFTIRPTLRAITLTPSDGMPVIVDAKI